MACSMLVSPACHIVRVVCRSCSMGLQLEPDVLHKHAGTSRIEAPQVLQHDQTVMLPASRLCRRCPWGQYLSGKAGCREVGEGVRRLMLSGQANAKKRLRDDEVARELRGCKYMLSGRLSEEKRFYSKRGIGKILGRV